MKKKSAALVLLTLCAFLLTGCASNQEAAPFTVMILDTYIDPAAVDAYAAALPEDLGAKILSLSMGDEKNDPMSRVAGMTALTAHIAAQELDIVIAPRDLIAGTARGESFFTPEEFLSADQIAQIAEDRKIRFEILDDDLNPTGDFTPVYGVDVTGHESLLGIFGEDPVGVYVVGNTTHPETAAAFFLDLIGQ